MSHFYYLKGYSKEFVATFYFSSAVDEVMKLPRKH